MNLPIYISLFPPPRIFWIIHLHFWIIHLQPPKNSNLVYTLSPPKNPSYSIPPPQKWYLMSPPFFIPPPPPWGTHPYTKNAFIPPNSSKGRCQKHPAGRGGCGFSWSSALHLHPPSIFQLSISSPHFFWLPSPPFLS